MIATTVTLTNFLLILLLVATLADHVTTNVALKRGLVEGNPVLASVIKQWGSTGLFIAKLGLWVAVVAADKLWGPAPPLLLAAGAIVFSAAAAWNIYQISIS